jgi:hypothetical protein
MPGLTDVPREPEPKTADSYEPWGVMSCITSHTKISGCPRPTYAPPSQEEFVLTWEGVAAILSAAWKTDKQELKWTLFFLEALTAWVESGPVWYERHRGEPLPAEGNWTYFAHALRAATMYE